MDEYVVVTGDNFEDVVENTGFDRKYLRRTLRDAHARDCDLIVYFSEGQWEVIYIHAEYSIEWIMRQIAAQQALRRG